MNKADIEWWFANACSLFKSELVYAQLDEVKALALRSLEAGKCTYCGGNDRDMPCAYPGDKVPGCLRDKRRMADGIGCKCAARCAADCVCDADWTPAELAALRTKLEEAERKLAQARAEGMEEAAKVAYATEMPLSDAYSKAFNIGCHQAAEAIRAKMKEQK